MQADARERRDTEEESCVSTASSGVVLSVLVTLLKRIKSISPFINRRAVNASSFIIFHVRTF